MFQEQLHYTVALCLRLFLTYCHITGHSVKFFAEFVCLLIIKPTRCTNSQFYFWNRTVHVSDRFSVHHQESSTVYTAIGICHTGFADCLLVGSGWK
jgi:hypothetical protein